MAVQQSPEEVNFYHTRHFPTWLAENKCSLFVSNYSKHKIWCLGRNKDGSVSTYFTEMLRPMGLCTSADGKTVYCSNVGNILRFENKTAESFDKFGTFDAVYYPQFAYICGDADIHDIRVNSTGDIFFVSALFNSVCKPSMTKSLEPIWTPKWITKVKTKDGTSLPPCEDRCHLNGMCLVNDAPKYVTVACRKDHHHGWREQINEGCVVDITNDEIVCSGLCNPHSPKWYQGKLWILETGTGHFGYIDIKEKKFIPCKFLPSFLRGLDFIGDYAIIAGSFDRHDYAFKDIPLGKILESKKMKVRAGIFIVDIRTFDVKHEFMFTNDKTELYDVNVVRDVERPMIVELNDNRLLNNFHLT
jgi:uncharacterized protein (TIGR03032 family)